MVPRVTFLRRFAVLLPIPVLFLVVALPLPAQPRIIVVGEVETSGFPEVSVPFYPMDAGGTVIHDLRADQFTMTENRQAVDVLNLTCPAPEPALPVSSVLSIDVSLSMAQSDGGPVRMDLAKLAARMWIQEMDDTYECAITSFAAGSYLNQDFTGDRYLLNRGLNNLWGDGSTNFLEGFLGNPGGAITVARRGQHKRIVIFLTDGIAPVDTGQVLDAARRANVEIYAVVLGGTALGDLQAIAEKSGGYCFNGVRTEEHIRSVFRAIHQRMRGIQPCTITWRSLTSCVGNRAVDIYSPPYGLYGNTFYTAPAWYSGRLAVLPDTLDFGPVQPGKTEDLTVVLRAEESPITILEFIPSNPSLTVLEAAPGSGFLPKTVNPGDSLVITVRAGPAAGSIIKGEVRIRTNLCYEDRIVLKIPSHSDLRSSIWVVRPDGGEKFTIGSDTAIGWTGVRPTDPVKVEYSIDSGKTWTQITRRGTGLSHPWNVPPTPSNRCLVRATHMNPDSNLYVLGHQSEVTDVGFLSDERVVTLDANGALHFWDAGRLTGTVPGSKDYTMALSRDGRVAALGGRTNRDVTLLDMESGAVLATIPGSYLTGGDPFLRVKSPLCFTPDGTAILTAVVEGNNDVTATTVRLHDARTGARRGELTDPDFPCRIAVYSPDGSYCAFGGTGGLIRLRTGDLSRVVYTLRDPNGQVEFLAFSPDGRELISVAEKSGRWTFSRWDIVQGARTASLPMPRPVNSIHYSPALRGLLVADGEGLFYDLSVMDVDREYVGHTASVNAARFNADGSLVATASGDRTVRIWKIDSAYTRTDISDSLWAIVAPDDVRSRDVEFGKVRVRTGKDSVLSAYIRNAGMAGVEITEMKITGPDSADFALLAGHPPFTLAPGESRTVELTFVPAGAGEREAVMEIASTGGRWTQRLHGTGVEPQLAIAGLTGNFLDFGPVVVGDLRDSLAWCVNVGNVPLEILSLRHRGPDDRQFIILGPDLSSPLLLPPGDSMQVLVRFAPVGTGYAQGGIAVGYNGDGSPEVIGLFGQGVSRTDPVIAAPDSLEFAPQRCLVASDTAVVPVENRGSASLEIEAATLDGPDAGDFFLAASSFPLSIPPGESRPLNIVFNPSGTGLRTARLVLKSNAVNAPERSVELRGSLSGAELAVEMEQIDLGRLCPEETGEVEILLRNHGPSGTGVRVTVIGRQGGSLLPTDSFVMIAGEDSARLTVRFVAGPDNGEFTAQIGLTDTLCGTAATVRLVGTVAAPVVEADPVGEICRGEEVRLSATGAEEYRWSPPDGLSCTDCPTPTAAPARTVTYVVTGYDADGCSGTDSVTVTVREQKEIVVASIGRGYRAFPGDTVSVAVELAAGAPSLADVGRLEIGFAYDPAVLEINANGLPGGLGGTLLEGWRADIVESGRGTLRVAFERDGGEALQGPGTLLRLECRPFLSNRPGTELSFDIVAPGNHCVGFVTSPGYVGVDSLCGLPYRLFEVSLTKYGLGEIAPNPAWSRDRISIPFSLAFDGNARLEIFDSRGERVAVPVNDHLPAGSYGVDWDASGVGSGVYYYRLTSGDFTETRRVVLVR